jgi:hypothetical protein
MLVKMQKKRNFYAVLIGMQIRETITENSMDVPQVTKNRITI